MRNLESRLLAASILVPVVLFWAADSRGQFSPHKDPRTGASPRPIADAAYQLRRAYGKVITYEDPLWEWEGELSPTGPNVLAKGGLAPKAFAFSAPEAAAATVGAEGDLPSRLVQVLTAYHASTTGPRFRILSSKYGLHIVPSEVRDRSGRFAPARNPLDENVFVATEERTAYGHAQALASAVAAAGSGLEFIFMTNSGASGSAPLRSLFADLFAAGPEDPRPFVWGTSNGKMIARDALIDLLDHSATTFYWETSCWGTAKESFNQCAFTLMPIMVSAPDGKGKDRMVTYDRCRNCSGPLAVPPGRTATK